MKLSPTLHKVAVTYNSPTIVEDNIDFWYDSLNDCYENDMPIDMILTYIDAIDDEDTEWVFLPIDYNRSMSYY